MATLEEKSKGVLKVGEHCRQCHQVDFLPFVCDECGHNYCSSHKLPESHGCKRSDRVVSLEQQQRQKTSPSPPLYKQQSQITTTNANTKTTPSPPATKSKNALPSLGRLKSLLSSSTNKPKTKSPQLSLLDLKRSALGDASIPTHLRRYVYIQRPETSYVDPISGESGTRPEKTKALFFSKDWVVGRVLDMACRKLDVSNNNNSDPSNRLGLFKNGHLLQYGAKFGDLVKDGSTLVLQKTNN
jgi:hypothetical protein